MSVERPLPSATSLREGRVEFVLSYDCRLSEKLLRQRYGGGAFRCKKKPRFLCLQVIKSPESVSTDMSYVLIISMVLCLRNSLELKAPIKGHPACIQAIVGPHNLPLIRPCRDVPLARFAVGMNPSLRYGWTIPACRDVPLARFDGLPGQLDSCRRVQHAGGMSLHEDCA